MVSIIFPWYLVGCHKDYKQEEGQRGPLRQPQLETRGRNHAANTSLQRGPAFGGHGNGYVLLPGDRTLHWWGIAGPDLREEVF